MAPGLDPTSMVATTPLFHLAALGVSQLGGFEKLSRVTGKALLEVMEAFNGWSKGEFRVALPLEWDKYPNGKLYESVRRFVVHKLKSTDTVVSGAARAELQAALAELCAPLDAAEAELTATAELEEEDCGAYDEEPEPDDAEEPEDSALLLADQPVGVQLPAAAAGASASVVTRFHLHAKLTINKGSMTAFKKKTKKGGIGL